MKPYVHEFEVEGDTMFPLDMLRYDGCFPAEEFASYRIATTMDYQALRELLTQANTADVLLGSRPGVLRVKLCKVWDKTWKPTEGRWESFRWRVVPGSHKVRPVL